MKRRCNASLFRAITHHFRFTSSCVSVGDVCRCSRREECANAAQNSRWLSYSAWCSAISRIEPQTASLDRGVAVSDITLRQVRASHSSTVVCSAVYKAHMYVQDMQGRTL